MEEYRTLSPEETREIGRRLAKSVRRGDVVVLEGDLGAGKTTFVQGLAEGLGIGDITRSPSFNIVNVYEGTMKLYHIDLYRLASGEDAGDLGLDEMLYNEDGVSVIEWGNRLECGLWADYISAKFSHEGADKRRIRIYRHRKKATGRDKIKR